MRKVSFTLEGYHDVIPPGHLKASASLNTLNSTEEPPQYYTDVPESENIVCD